MGSPGCGKTYFCAAMIAWGIGKMKDYKYFSESSLFSKLRASFSSEEQQEDYYYKIKRWCEFELFMLDDIGSTGQGQTGWRQEVLFEIVDLRHRSKLPTVFTTNLNESEIKEKLGLRTHSRLFDAENTVINLMDYADLRLLSKEVKNEDSK
jgi:DNA replication protein DnaC